MLIGKGRSLRKLSRTLRSKARRGKLGPYLVKLLGPLFDFSLACRARARRRLLRRTTFIAITGSCGKTTTTHLVRAILSQNGDHVGGEGNNGPHSALRAVLRTPAMARFCVQEVGAEGPGSIARRCRIMRPQIGIVTMIGHDHYKAFRTLEETAEEKGKLIEVLPLAGTAILNADDSYVREMASRTSARVITFGLSPEAHVRASEISSAWPQRLALTVTYAERSVRVRTRLVGSHWVPSVLAAVACGVSAGFGLDLCARAVETVNPVFRRYSVHPVPGGPVFVLDCAKAPLWTIPSSLAFVRDAQAPRKTFILGTISDYQGKGGRTHRRTVRDALDVADRVIFVGPHSASVEKMPECGEGRLAAVQTSFEAARVLARESVADELVFIKASSTDHLERIALSFVDEIVCWRERCGKRYGCIRCDRFRSPSAPPLGLDDLADQRQLAVAAPTTGIATIL